MTLFLQQSQLKIGIVQNDRAGHAYLGELGFGGDEALTPAIVQAMQKESQLSVSAISCFEVALLSKRGRLELTLPVEEWLSEALGNSGVEQLPSAEEWGELRCTRNEFTHEYPKTTRDRFERLQFALAAAKKQIG